LSKGNLEEQGDQGNLEEQGDQDEQGDQEEKGNLEEQGDQENQVKGNQEDQGNKEEQDQEDQENREGKGDQGNLEEQEDQGNLEEQEGKQDQEDQGNKEEQDQEDREGKGDQGNKEDQEDHENQEDQENQDQEDPLEGKYFPPMYVAEEESISPLENLSNIHNIKKIQIDPNNIDNVFTLDKVLSENECKWIIERGEKLGFEPATVYSTEEDNNVIRKDIRDNFRVLEKFPAFGSRLWEVVKGLIPETIDGKKSIGFYELFRYYKYLKGNNFAPHVDHVVFSEDLDGTESRFTFIIYLNEGYKGGFTRFPNLGVDVIPTSGKVLLFRHENFHEGVTVEEGVKYLIRTDVMYK